MLKGTVALTRALSPYKKQQSPSIYCSQQPTPPLYKEATFPTQLHTKTQTTMHKTLAPSFVAAETVNSTFNFPIQFGH